MRANRHWRPLDPTAGANQKREPVDFEIFSEVAPELREPTLLRLIGQFLPGLRAFEFRSRQVLRVMHHLMNEDGGLCRRLAGPVPPKVNGLRIIIVNGDDIMPVS